MRHKSPLIVSKLFRRNQFTFSFEDSTKSSETVDVPAKMEAAAGATSLPTDAVLSLSSETSGVPAVMEAAAGATSLLINVVLSLSSETVGCTSRDGTNDSRSVVGDGGCATSDDRSHCGNINVGDGNDVAVVGELQPAAALSTLPTEAMLSVSLSLSLSLSLSVCQRRGRRHCRTEAV